MKRGEPDASRGWKKKTGKTHPRSEKLTGKKSDESSNVAGEAPESAGRREEVNQS